MTELLTEDEAKVLDWLSQSHDDMVELLRKIVNIDSGSYNKAGVDAVSRILREYLELHKVSCVVRPNDIYGDCMHAFVKHEMGLEAKPVVLMGHCDTVFPIGTASERPFRIEGDLAYGPGVADMKAGLVINTFVLAALARTGVSVPIVGLYTSDEEIASPSSRSFIEEHMTNARAVLNAEPGRPSGNVVTGRKGAIFVDIEVVGKAAHSGGNHHEGCSAIEAMCRKVIKLHRLTDYELGTTVNVGLVNGGSSVNTVAQVATASIDIRFMSMETMSVVKEQLLEILSEVEISGTSARIVNERNFLPLVQSDGSKTMFKQYVKAAREIGYDVGGEFTGGSADSGFTAAAGVPTLCATGPVGGNVHTAEEWLKINTLVPRAKAIALTAIRSLRL